ncbi:MAG: response regulator [Deltaproteobacteria bacterium]|nr:response regulator [Deltaproteobacteria bacterium]
MPYHILIVDDEPPIRGLLKKILEKNNYRCRTAANAAEARTVLKEKAFELILCDIRMPGESGLDFIGYVRRVFPETAVIMVTGMDDPHEAETALNLGIYGYLIKPLEPNQLLINVANALRRRELEIKERNYRQGLERAVAERTEDLLIMNETLRKRETELSLRTRELEEANSALKVLLKRREEDKSALEEGMLAQVKQGVEPFLGRLQETRLDEEQRQLLEILETSLREVISPFIRELSSPSVGLTPTQIQVAHLVKQGKTIKEIALILNLSPNTVMSHRFQIRSKFGLLSKKTNLHTFLHSLNDQ